MLLEGLWLLGGEIGSPWGEDFGTSGLLEFIRNFGKLTWNFQEVGEPGH